MSENNELGKVFYKKVLPLVKVEDVYANGSSYIKKTDNLTNDEIRSISCHSELRMLWKGSTGYYFAEKPLVYSESGTGVKWLLYFMYDELTEEDKIKYEDRCMLVPVAIENVVQVYDDNSKRLFGKRKTLKK